MLSIKTKIKLKQIQKTMKNKLSKFLYYILKPIIILDDKVNKYKRDKIKKSVEKMDEELFIHLLVKNHIIKELIKYTNHEICLVYEKDYYDDETILSYTRDLKNNVLKSWSYKINFNEEKGINSRLMELLKKELKKYPEIEFCDYQHNKYCSKVLIIKLKE
ncbi:hypothetical protein [Clostridium sporogenes]|uniref:hypothetical protein n=1 Tax=Clostridium sporogenes TaxID=1509 RepID=UPI0013D79431|nr:hypothetical protein [Clostridium sporogenes]NFH40809.1 hypothetical protein [Clostridium sporogenes]